MDVFTILNFIKFYWRVFVLTLVPIIFLPLIVNTSQALQCFYVIVVIGLFWMTEVMNLAVSSLIPIVLFPVFLILTPGKVASNYMKDVTLMLIGSIMVAKGVENQNLHRRMALFVLKLMGPNYLFQYMGFMLSTWFLSMWITNTAATAMMLTLGQSVMQQMRVIEGIDENSDDQGHDNPVLDEGDIVNIEMQPSNMKKFADDETVQRVNKFEKGLYLGIAYAATCGGIATLTGTAPNLVMHGFITERYGSNANLNYGTYIAFGFPLSVMTVIIAWCVISLRYIGFRQIFRKKSKMSEENPQNKSEEIRKMIRHEYEKLDKMKFGEVMMLITFMALITLWILREPGIPLLGALFKKTLPNGKTVSYWSDGTSSILITILMFILPAQNPFKIRRPKKLLDWPIASKEFPWGLIFLFGAGFAIAEACEVSGLSNIIGGALSNLRGVDSFAVLLIVGLSISFLTEVTSNTATSTIMLPIMLQLAECVQIHPMKMALTTCIASSFSFCLPAATPPNAIIFSTGKIRVIDMASTGLILNFLCVFILTVMAYYYSIPIFHTKTFPDWASTNCTS